MNYIEKLEIQLNKKFIVLYEFTLAWVAWECDSEGAVVKDENENKYLILTQHGSPYIASKDDLLKQIADYQNLISDTRKAITYLEK